LGAIPFSSPLAAIAITSSASSFAKTLETLEPTFEFPRSTAWRGGKMPHILLLKLVAHTSLIQLLLCLLNSEVFL
jgi:hypothetical protein